MALKKTMIQRLFSIARCPNLSPSLRPPLRPDPAKISSNPDQGQRRPLHQASGMIGRSIPTGHDQLIEKLRGFDTARDRIRFQGLIHPPPPPQPEEKIALTARDVNKLLRASHLETMKARLNMIHKAWVSYSEFLEICKEGCSGDEQRASDMAKLLDDSGAVIVLGSAVCLQPHQVVKAMEGLINEDPGQKKELEAMEKRRSEMEKEADALVRRELWMGLGYMVAQTAVFMRLTFWELSWDVMEPICFYVTSAYFMAGYAFFLQTSKEPSFEGFYQSRLQAKLNKLMASTGFDLHRYHHLSRACYPHRYNNANHSCIHLQPSSCIHPNTMSFST